MPDLGDEEAYGRMQENKDSRFRNLVYNTFSDRRMIAVALLSLPVVILEYLSLPPEEMLMVYLLDGLIWLTFLLELAFKAYAEKSLRAYVNSHRTDSMLSIIIIISPAMLVFTPLGAAVPLLRLFRLLRLIGYGSKATMSMHK